MIFRCKMCGGMLELAEGQTIAVCDSCGTKQTLPNLSDERRANLYDRAGYLRCNSEFDKAMLLYEQILNEDKTDAEAYWSMVLCRYGIQYVEDTKTGHRIPTVNRMQLTSVFDDTDYKAAMMYADPYRAQMYRSEAEQINQIQREIFSVSEKEEPFDIFICYKETDENGKRTQDSVLANEIYHELEGAGFKVFLSRITLEKKAGINYEPYIFSALHSAKVMVVLGTKPEYFFAPWVKNEWSRYLSLIKNGDKKVLVPAYRDMNPYDLPEEFAHLQAQDMSRLGFVQDLIHGIKKLSEFDLPSGKHRETFSDSGFNNASLLKRMFLFLEDGDWSNANAYCEKILDNDPECAEAYLGKLLIDVKVKRKEDLTCTSQDFEHTNNFQKTMRFANDELKNLLTEYVEKNKEFRLEHRYVKACDYIKTIENNYENVAQVFGEIKDEISSEKSEGSIEVAQMLTKRSVEDNMLAAKQMAYQNASDMLDEILGYKDADFLSMQCMQKAQMLGKERTYRECCDLMSIEQSEEGYKAIAKRLNTIADYKDAATLEAKCLEKITEIYKRREREKEEREAKKRAIAYERRYREQKRMEFERKSAFVTGAFILALILFYIFSKIVHNFL